MDILGEFILEVLLEGLFHITVENPKVKTWVKTVAFLLISQVFTALAVVLAASAWKENNDGWIVVAVIVAVYCIGTIIGAIYGHRRNWKNW